MCRDEEVTEIARRCVRMAIELGLTVSTAESLTAGMTSAAIASIPGASAVLVGGAVTYCDEIKHRVLGVDADSLRQFTAVSSRVAEEMASGAMRLFDSDIAVSLTGYAGPGAGEDGTPAGTVFIGLASERGVVSERHVFSGTRNDVRREATACALGLVTRELLALGNS